MSNETQTTQPMSPEDIAVQSEARAEGLAAAEANNAQQVIADAPRGEDDVPPIGPIPADDLLFSMNESQAVYLYIAHGLSGAHSHDEMIEMLQAKRDAAPPPDHMVTVQHDDMEFKQNTRLVQVTDDLLQDGDVPAAEPETPAPEREKVWNIHLQAWV